MSNYIIKDGELYHYGVPGMRWGQKKAKPTGGGGKKKGKRAKQEALSKMSDDELRKKINRMEMENKYNKLTKKESIAGNLAKKIATTAITSVGTAIAIKTINSGIKKAGGILKDVGDVKIKSNAFDDMFKDMKDIKL